MRNIFFIIGDWGLGPIPNPQSPSPIPKSPLINMIIKFNFIFNFYLEINNNTIFIKLGLLIIFYIYP